MANITWSDNSIIWSSNSFTWDEVQLVQEIIQRSGGGVIEDDMPWMKPEKKKKLIKLICKVKGKTYDESKYVNDFKIKVSDIKLAAKEILGVEILTENIKF